ncbi:hypothetical protein NP493_194g01002 [Ridgeia piscesae]|uniref:Uncharacterized protein n=1 Tax=Ridgeia piscesae TaxID=27915 RepID=A0AAD9P1T8_RIDPI|nr:hypothetical protein NP493_194g01002 [Ridgeia piscesae]
MSLFTWTPADKQTDLVDDDELEDYNKPENNSPWYGQQPTQGWYPMMTRVVPSYMPNYQMPTVGPAPPSPTPNPPVKRRRVKRHSKPFLHGHRGVALLVLAMIAIMIGVIVGIIVLVGKNIILKMLNVIKTGAPASACSLFRMC